LDELVLGTKEFLGEVLSRAKSFILEPQPILPGVESTGPHADTGAFRGGGFGKKD
jgi:hypothetical protein